MAKDELQAAAEAKGLTVTRSDGRDDLEPTAADYQAALDHAAAIEAGAVEPDPPQATERTFTVTGAFPVLGVEPGGSFTALVQPDGAIIGERGRTVTVVGPLLEGGAIHEGEEGEDG